MQLEDLIDSRIGVHDDNQFEVKLDYTLDATARRGRYVVETYLFVPRSLGLDAHTYRREQFGERRGSKSSMRLPMST